jgi:Tfp pilus assembly protein PilO
MMELLRTMQGIKVSKREKWLVAVALATGMVYYLTSSFLFPYLDSSSAMTEKIAIFTKRITHYRRLLRGRDSVKAALEETQRQVVSAEMGLLENNIDALANAELQGLVKEMVQAKGLNFRRSDLLPVKNVSPEYSKVSTHIEMTGNLDQVVALLTGLETTPQIIFVEELRILPIEINNPKNKQEYASLMISGLKRVQPDSTVPAKKS